MKMLIGLIFLAHSAWAQVSLLSEPLLKIPELPSHMQDVLSRKKVFQDKSILEQEQPLAKYSEKQIANLAKSLDDQFKKTLDPLSEGVPSCQSSEIENYLLALQTAGQFNECAQIANQCMGQTQGPRPFLIAALCESSRFSYSGADYFFIKATDPKWNQSSDYTEALFQHASYSLFGHHENQVDTILSQIPGSSAEERKLMAEAPFNEYDYKEDLFVPGYFEIAAKKVKQVYKKSIIFLLIFFKKFSSLEQN